MELFMSKYQYEEMFSMYSSYFFKALFLNLIKTKKSTIRSVLIKVFYTK